MQIRWNRLERLRPRRRGSLTTFLVVSLTVLLGVLALALDRAYVNMAHVELSRAADAAALAAAQALVHDHQLRHACDPAEHRRAAIEAACRFARFNFTAGDPTELHTDSDDLAECDVRFGRLIRTHDGFGEFDAEFPGMPDTVQVTARRTSARDNPVGMLLGSFLGVRHAEVVARSQATLDDQIVGFKPVCGVPVPMVPLAILLSDSECRRLDTWEESITKRRGHDSFGFDESTCQVVRGSDGIPELELVFGVKKGDHDEPNVAWLELCHHFDGQTAVRQLRSGLSPEDLEPLGGSLSLDVTGRLPLRGSFHMPVAMASVFREIIGQHRVWGLFAAPSQQDAASKVNLTLVGFVGARVMDVRFNDDGLLVVRVQPCFVVTRSAIAHPGRDVPHHATIRKISITG